MTDQPANAAQPPQKGKKRAIKLEIPKDLQAQYVNIALITHTMSEIIMDYAQVLPNTPSVRVSSRLVMTPTNAKTLHRALGESLAKFEALHGEVKIPPTLADRLFMQAGGNDSPENEDTNE